MNVKTEFVLKMEEKKSISRKELYDKVWSTTMNELSKEFSLPTQILKRICKENNIPIPKSGHWKKIEFKKPVEMIPLDNINFKEGKLIDIDSYVIEYQNSFGFKLEKRILEIEIESSEHLKVPLRLTRPCPLVARAKTYLSKQYGRKYKGFEDVVSTGSDYLSISVRKQNVPRALRIMDSLIKLFESRGHSIHLEHWRTTLTIKEQKFEIKFREKCNRVKVREGKWGTTELVPNNLLSVKYARSYSTKEWVDSQYQPLEDQIVKIVASFELMAEHEIEDKKAREIYWAEQERLEAIEKEKQKRLEWENKKVEILKNHLDQWQKYKTQKRILQDFKLTIDVRNDIKASNWFNWAEMELEKSNPLSEGFSSFLNTFEYKSDLKMPLEIKEH